MFPPSRIMTVANSNHPGGVNLLLADGSIRFLEATVNVNAWRALGTRNGGEILSADSYATPMSEHPSPRNRRATAAPRAAGPGRRSGPGLPASPAARAAAAPAPRSPPRTPNARARPSATRLDAWKAGSRRRPCHSRPVAGGRRGLAGRRQAAGLPRRATASRSAPVRLPVTLSVADARGKAARKKVVYLVGTDPTPTVIRHDGP